MCCQRLSVTSFLVACGSRTHSAIHSVIHFAIPLLELRSIWTPVFYTNALSVVPCVFMGLLMGEFSPHSLHALHSRLSVSTEAERAERLVTIWWVALSCLVGLSISWAGFKCQSVLTATSYTVVGVVNKMLTVSVNVLIWDQHASAAGLLSLGVCLLGGSLYQQAPQRAPATRKGIKSRCSDVDLETASIIPPGLKEAAADWRSTPSLIKSCTYEDDTTKDCGQSPSGIRANDDETTVTTRASSPETISPRAIKSEHQLIEATTGEDDKSGSARHCVACNEPLASRKGSRVHARFCSQCGAAQP